MAGQSGGNETGRKVHYRLTGLRQGITDAWTRHSGDEHDK
jgi:hypothetical protein